MAIVGLGMDICSVERIRKILEGPRGARFRQRVFTPGEQRACDGRADPAASFAARFAAKEALVKALGGPAGLRWLDIEVVRESGAPQFRLSGVAQAQVAHHHRMHLTMTHDAGMAAATAILESISSEGEA